ncbi:receptor-interacting serine/threonine-protein kinase 3-like [Pagrus major]|uniref:receptor-interacting serine/threonine-protein kinase 3-like n=1 Tax=Pagrus major TaxID=143350 RepID=UPI003CC86FDD
MALLSHKTERVGDESLGDEWVRVGSGGFGVVYRARHKGRGVDVAIKILHSGVCPKALWEEAIHMEKVPCEFVLRVYGIYEGCPPFSRGSMQQGIVMEFMGRGSVQSLLSDLSGPPPWPLAFRLAHQVALGMKFLHSVGLMHQDLKPSNVLLNDDLNAKLADFGLSRVSTSAVNSSRETTGEIGGSYKYMPPEAFEAKYEPVRAFDRYSYGILLWSIVTGKEPYPAAEYNRVALRIPKGDRPPCEVLDQVEVEGLRELVDLMKSCWEADPDKRPGFKKCLNVTEKVFSKHKRKIHDAVVRVLNRLDSPTSNQRSETSVSFHRPPHQAPERAMLNDEVDMRTPVAHSSPIQDVFQFPTKEMTDEEKEKFVDDKRATLIQDVSEVMAIADELDDMVHPETYSKIAAVRTSQEQMRMLYMSAFRSGGRKVKAAFYDALKKHHPQLV